MEYYWELLTKEGVSIYIPPESVAKVNKHMADGTPIVTRSMTVPVDQVKAFRVTNKLYSSQPLLDAAAQAFKEPVYNDDGSIVCRWVKKSVTSREYATHFSKIPSYHKLSDNGAHVWVAMLSPVHDIDLNRVEYCTEEENVRLDRERTSHA